MIIGPMIFIYFILYTHAHYLSYITTSIIFITKTHGKYSNPQAHHLSYDAIIRNHETLFAI